MSSRSNTTRAENLRVSVVLQNTPLMKLVTDMVSNKKGTAAPKTATGQVLQSSQKATPAEALKALGLTVEVIEKLKNRDSVNGIIPLQELVEAGQAVIANKPLDLVNVVEAGTENAGVNDNYTRKGNADKYSSFAVLTVEEIEWCATKVGYSRSSVKTNPAYSAIVAKIDAFAPMIKLLEANKDAVKTVEAEVAKLQELLQSVPKTIQNDKKSTPAERTVALSDLTNVVERLAQAKTAVAYFKSNPTQVNAAFWLAYWNEQYASESYAKLKKARCATKEASDKLRAPVVDANDKIIKHL